MYQDFINNVILKNTAAVIYSASLTMRKPHLKTSVEKMLAVLPSYIAPVYVPHIML